MKNLLKITITISIFLFSLITNNSFSQAGTLDQTFGDHGLVINDSNLQVEASVILNDEKILVAGRGGPNYLFVLSRFMPDGSPDASFGVDGRIRYSIGEKFKATRSIALQVDGKILITGDYHFSADRVDAGIFRFMPDGKIDSSFGTNGLDSAHIDNLNTPQGIVIQEDGKIVITGMSTNTQGVFRNAFLARFMPDGGLDPTFGSEGIVTTEYVNTMKIVSLVGRPNGKLVTGGTLDYNLANSPYMINSYNTDGSVDESFGVNGRAQFVFGQGGLWNNQLYAMALQPDGKIVCTGITGKGDAITMGVCRFNADGTIDESFGENGGTITPYYGEPESRNITIQPDGKILTVGDVQEFIHEKDKVLLARYNENGQLDPTFAENGIAAIYVDTIYDGANGQFVNIVADNKILVTGTCGCGGNIPKIFFARFNGDNVLAANFKEVKATQNNDAITITWQTLNESGTKSFTVERSMNANDYAGINTFPAKGVASSYSYTDKNPLSGTSYYRIRENAANGTNTFSPVVKVVFNDNGIISLYPNPAKNTVTVKGLNKNTTATIRITDMNGREISKQNFTQSSSATLNIRALAQGSYFVLVEQNGKVTKLRIVKE
ncbi:MAG: T9SS type A sorting domain-containing protein [Chitinophagaceae bacterium]